MQLANGKHYILSRNLCKKLMISSWTQKKHCNVHRNMILQIEKMLDGMKICQPIKKSVSKIVWQNFFVDAILYVHFDDMEKKARALNSEFFFSVFRNTSITVNYFRLCWQNFDSVLNIRKFYTFWISKKEDIFVMTMASNIINLPLNHILIFRRIFDKQLFSYVSGNDWNYTKYL